MSHQSFPKATGSITDGYVLTWSQTDGYWKPKPNAIVGSGWTSAYDVDFRTVAPQTILADGAFTVSGKTWNMVNYASADSVVIDSSGLTINCNATNTDFANATRNAAMVTINLSEVIPNYDPLRHAVRVWAWNSANNADANFELAFLSLDRTQASAPINRMLHMYKKGFIGGLGGLVHYANGAINNGTQGDIQSTENYSDDVFVIQLNFPGDRSYQCLSGVYNTGDNAWPTIPNLRYRWNYSMNYGAPGTVLNMVEATTPFKVSIGAQTVNTSNNFEVTFARIKIEYLDMGSPNSSLFSSDVVWIPTKTSNYVVNVTDKSIPVDTTSGSVTITLPASPSDGESHLISDVGGLAATNNIIVNGNGRNIIGSSTYVITGPYNTLEVAYHAGKNIWVII